jgi:interferon-induced transmembrane protein/zinc ribbon protein
MFCPQCGTSNADTAAVCMQCGRNLQPGVPAPPMPVAGVVMPPPGATVPNYLVFAILTTVFCCLPTGIPAIIFAAQVNGKLLAGDYAGAQAASKNAKLWCWVSFGIGLVGTLFWLMIAGAGVLHRMGHQ